MGFAVAQAAREAGADVVLVSGPVALPTPPGVRRVDVESAADMHAAVQHELRGTGCLHFDGGGRRLSAARRTPTQKIKKTHEQLDAGDGAHHGHRGTVVAQARRGHLSWASRPRPTTVEQNARGKLLEKNLDMIAANEVGADKAFDCEDNDLLVLWRAGRSELPRGAQVRLARAERLSSALIAEAWRSGRAGAERGTAHACTQQVRAAVAGADSRSAPRTPTFRCPPMQPPAQRALICEPVSKSRSSSSPGGPSSSDRPCDLSSTIPGWRPWFCRARGLAISTASCSAISWASSTRTTRAR